MGRIAGAVVIASITAVLVLWGFELFSGPLSSARSQAAERPVGMDVVISDACRSAVFAHPETDPTGRAPVVFPVRAAPDQVSLPLDTVPAGAAVMVCDYRLADGMAGADDGAPAEAGWFGIVYGETDALCLEDDIRPHAGAYDGPCRWGWVEASDLVFDRPDDVTQLAHQ